MGNIHLELENFLTAVSCSYQQFDGGYFLLEHKTKILSERIFIPFERLHERSAYAGNVIAWLSARRFHGCSILGRRQQIERHPA
jgi:hypothetical protein